MTVTTKSKADLVAGQTATVQAQASGYVDFSLGSILLAVAEAVADVVLWLQGLILYLLSITRAATSQSADLDSWYADFGTTFARLAAMPATVALTFARLSTSGSTYVPVGATVQTPDGSQTFVVTTDITNGAYNANAGGTGVPGYVMAATVGSVVVPSQALAPGSSSNVLAGSLSVITSSIVGVDTVTNVLAAVGGSDKETDAALRARWPGFLQALGKGTIAAITASISTLQLGLFIKILENVNYAGATVPGMFTVLLDDGTGSPPGSLLTAATTNTDAVRPVTSTFSVNAPVVVTATTAMTVTVAAGFDKPTVGAAVKAAILAYVNATGFGGTIPYTRLTQLAYDASPGVANVSAVTLNGGTADLTSTSLQVIRATSGSTTITTP